MIRAPGALVPPPTQGMTSPPLFEIDPRLPLTTHCLLPPSCSSCRSSGSSHSGQSIIAITSLVVVAVNVVLVARMATVLTNVEEWPPNR